MDDQTFVNELNQPTINVPRAALSFARSLAYPDLDIDYYLARLDRLAEGARPGVTAASTLEDRADALSEYLFSKMNFRGAGGNGQAENLDYTHPENSFLNRVLDNRIGIPISLSVVYISVAQRLGLSAYGIGLPGHFITGIYEKGSQVLLDPFNKGQRLSIADCGRLVRKTTGSTRPFNPKWLSAISPVNLLARMLTNLCHAYIQGEDWPNAITVIQHLQLVQPEIDFHLRDLGYLYMYNGSLRLSAQYLEEYLRRVPDAPDFANVRTSLQIVAGRLALWN